jgi:hypothetical protein
MADFSPIFSTITEWNQFEALIDLIIGINQVMAKLENKFTVALVFDRSLLSVYESNLNVGVSNSYEFQMATINFSKVIFFFCKTKFKMIFLFILS